MGPGQGGPGQGGPGQPGPGQFTQHPYGPAAEAARPAGTGWPGKPGPGQAPGWRHVDPAAPAGANPGPGGFERAGGTIITQRDSALPDQPPGSASGPIAAIETDNVAAFARDLRVLRAKAGLDYPDMAEKSHYTMRTLASAAGGLRLPTLPVLIAYVRACGGDQAEWEERWGKLMKAVDGQGEPPTAGKDATTAGAGGPVSDARPHASAPGTPASGPAQAPAKADEVYVITSAPARDKRW